MAGTAAGGAKARETRAAKRALREGDSNTPNTPKVFRSRSGEILRFRPTDGSMLDVPEDLKENGWTYQWCVETVWGEPSTDLIQMYSNGFRPVPADSRIGHFFLPPGVSTDCIRVGGQILMERQEGLTAMYIEETNQKTRLQYEGLMDKSSDLVVPDGFNNRGKEVKRVRKLVKASAVVKDLVDAEDGIPDEE